MGSKYSFSQNTITNAAIGDNATQIVQGWDPTQLQKLADDLSKAHPAMEQKATSPEEKDDAKTVDAIRREAANGNKNGVIEQLKKLGKWGWETLKELGVSVAVETLKKTVGI